MLSDKQILDCRILRGLARVLGLSAVATTTALTFLHRVQLCQHGCDLPSQELVSACTFLAAKVEEVRQHDFKLIYIGDGVASWVHVSTNQLINTARVLADPSQQHLLQALAPMQQQQQEHTAGSTAQHAAAGTTAEHQAAPEHAASAACDAAVQQLPASQAIVVGDEYYAAKEQLFVAEQVVLRLMRFELGVEQPHKHLFNFCRLLGLQQEQSAAAVCVLNDGIAYTTLVCKYQAAVVAAAALQYVLSSSQPQLTAGRAAAGQHAAGSMQASTAQSDAQHSSRHGGRTGHGSSRDHPASDSPAYSQRVLNDSADWIQWVGLKESEVSAAQQELFSFFQSGNVD